MPRGSGLKIKTESLFSRGRGKPTCQKLDAQTKHHPPSPLGWDELFTRRLERRPTVKDIIMNENRWFMFPEKRPWKRMKSKWENVIKQKKKVGCKTERQPGGEVKSKSIQQWEKGRCIQHKENVEDKGSTKAPVGSHARELWKKNEQGVRCWERKEPIVWPAEEKRVSLAWDQLVLNLLGMEKWKGKRDGWREGWMDKEGGGLWRETTGTAGDWWLWPPFVW